jgi:hydrogenase maturation protease
MATLVLGIGNTLLSDEGNGVHVVNYLRQHWPDEADVTYLDGGTLSFTLAEAIQTHDALIVVDAAQFRAAPGTVRCLVDAEMDEFLRGPCHSVHEVNLTDLLDIARLTDSLPAPRALVGIQPHSLDWGEQPSAETAAAIPVAAECVRALLARWQKNGRVLPLDNV